LALRDPMSETMASTVLHSGVATDDLAPCNGPAVWERLWRYTPSDAKDDRALERERTSRRWQAVEACLHSTFGGIARLDVVELGSGRGDAAVLLARGGARVTLVDYCEPALAEARRRFDRLGLDAEYRLADLRSGFDGLAGRFDVAVSFGVIEHFRGPERTRAIAAHRAVLRPGGLAIISVPNARCPTYRLWKAVLEMRGWWPYGMEIPYTHRELRQRARRAGFARVRTQAFDFRWSVQAHLWNGLLRRGRPATRDTASVLDPAFGATLVAFAWAGTEEDA